MVALTGIEPAGWRSSSVHFGLSSCIFSSTQFDTSATKAVQIADVLPWCCPEARIWLLAGRSNPRRPPPSDISSLTCFSKSAAPLYPRRIPASRRNRLFSRASVSNSYGRRIETYGFRWNPAASPSSKSSTLQEKLGSDARKVRAVSAPGKFRWITP